jgi:hypothetical protein
MAPATPRRRAKRRDVPDRFPCSPAQSRLGFRCGHHPRNSRCVPSFDWPRPTRTRRGLFLCALAFPGSRGKVRLRELHSRGFSFVWDTQPRRPAGLFLRFQGRRLGDVIAVAGAALVGVGCSCGCRDYRGKVARFKRSKFVRYVVKLCLRVRGVSRAAAPRQRGVYFRPASSRIATLGRGRVHAPGPRGQPASLRETSSDNLDMMARARRST